MKLTEFQNITPIANIPSILKHGILSYTAASVLPHRSVALQDIQDRRDVKQVPGGLNLHEYANVYFHARNPMMYRRQNEAGSLCVLRISTDILNASGAVITDQNAASDWVRFMAPKQIGELKLDYIFAEDWTHPEDQREGWRHKSAKCAEALIPQGIPPKFLLGAYIVNEGVQAKLNEIGFDLPTKIDADLFFQ